MFDPISIGLGVAGLAGTLFGGEEGSGPGSNSSSASGFAALPPEVQKQWLEYANRLNQYSSGQGLQTAPLHQFQQRALNAYGSPDYSPQGLAQYTMPYQHILDRINERYDIEAAQQRGNNATSGKGDYNSGIQRNANMLNESRQRSLAEAGAGITNQALDLRNQTLGQQFDAGAMIRGVNQENLPYELLNRYAGLLNQFPQSSTSSSSQWGDTRRPDMLSRVGSLGLAAAGGQFGNLGGFSGAGGGGFNSPLGGLNYAYQQPRNAYEGQFRPEAERAAHNNSIFGGRR